MNSVVRKLQGGFFLSVVSFALIGHPIAFAETRDATFELYERLQHMQERVQVLNGQVEVLNHQLHSMQQKQLAQYKDLDARLVKLAQTQPQAQSRSLPIAQGQTTTTNTRLDTPLTSPAPLINNNTNTNPTAAVNQSAYPNLQAQANTRPEPRLDAKLDLQTERNKQGSPAATVSSVTTTNPGGRMGNAVNLAGAMASAQREAAVAPSPITPSTPSMATLPSYPAPTTPARALSDKEEYHNAYAYIREKRYPQAQQSLAQFLKTYPKSPYAANAHYWLGELNLLTGDIYGALQQFEAIVTRFPQNNKVPDALLKLGYIYDDIGQLVKARGYLERLPAQYAGSTAAQLATVRLQQMRQATY